jgi:hypothetical protein
MTPVLPLTDEYISQVGLSALDDATDGRPARANIIFIHGLNEGPKATWTDTETEWFWPGFLSRERLLTEDDTVHGEVAYALGKDMTGVRSFLFAFRIPIQRLQGSDGVQVAAVQAAQQLLNSIEAMKSDFENVRTPGLGDME